MTKRQIPPGMDLPDTYDYEGLKRIAYREDRSIESLIVLAPTNDPFYSGRPAGKDGGEWFAGLWKKHKIGHGVHLRRLHYLFMSTSVLMRNSTPYKNSDDCWQGMLQDSKAARYLHLVPTSAIVDRRNAEAITNSRETGEPFVEIESGELEELPDDMPEPPQAALTIPEPTQRYQIEIWAEKTTMNDILEPLAAKYDITLVTGMGELSITACNLFIDRAEQDGRPMRILYVSDSDDPGKRMPVSVARKIEFMIYDRSPDLDVQVRAVVLTEEQIVEYALPRDTEGRTELDALEALHPGELERILEREIARYYDNTLAKRISAKAKPVKTLLNNFNAEIHAQFADQIEGVRERYDDLLTAEQDYRVAAETIWHAIEERLNAEMPDTSGIKWPEPKAGDEDLDPMFDSTRDYLDQIDCYKIFQGKPSADETRQADKRRGPNADKAQCAEVRKLQKTGMSERDIADRTGLGRQTVRTIVRQTK
jgi:hypothetical protein